MEIDAASESPAASSLLTLQSLPLHLPPKSYPCPIPDCTLICPSKKELNNHKVTGHSFVKCTAKRCSKIFVSEKKRNIHLAKCHKETLEDKPAPTVLTSAQNSANIELESSLIGDLQGATLDYLGSIKRLATSEGYFNAQRFQSLTTCIPNELVEGMPIPSGVTQGFMLHALAVALGLSVAQGERNGETGNGMGKVEGMDEGWTGRQGEGNAASDISPGSSTSTPTLHPRKSCKKAHSSSSPKRRGPKPSSNLCKTCQKIFPYKKELQAHRQKAHPKRNTAPFSVQQLPLAPPAVETHRCTECEKSFQTETGLACHFQEKHSH